MDDEFLDVDDEVARLRESIRTCRPGAWVWLDEQEEPCSHDGCERVAVVRVAVKRDGSRRLLRADCGQHQCGIVTKLDRREEGRSDGIAE